MREEGRRPEPVAKLSDYLSVVATCWRCKSPMRMLFSQSTQRQSLGCEACGFAWDSTLTATPWEPWTRMCGSWKTRYATAKRGLKSEAPGECVWVSSGCEGRRSNRFIVPRSCSLHSDNRTGQGVQFGDGIRIGQFAVLKLA